MWETRQIGEGAIKYETMRKAPLFVVFVLCAPPLLAQHKTYSVTEFFLGVTMKFYRDGSKIRQDTPDNVSIIDRSGEPKGVSWDPSKSPVECVKLQAIAGSNDVFDTSKEMMKQLGSAKETGTETFLDREAKVLEGATPDGKAKVWIDAETGLLLKALLYPKDGGAPQTFLEVKAISFDEPEEELFKLPSSCPAQ
jgi:hypothetical protein